jgi:hypothetical protein
MHSVKRHSIYSLPALQRILDRFSVGKVIRADYFGNIGSQVWRHFIETPQGDFELYSYPPELQEYAEKKIIDKLTENNWPLFPLVCHSFDRYHRLAQRSKKIPITVKQLATDMKPMVNQTLDKIFRVYGTIVQMYFGESGVLASYAEWQLLRTQKGVKSETLISSLIDSYEKIDQTLESLPLHTLTYQRFTLKDNCLKLFLSNGYCFKFVTTKLFPAAEIGFTLHGHEVEIFSETNINYIKSV